MVLARGYAMMRHRLALATICVICRCFIIINSKRNNPSCKEHKTENS